MGWLDSVADLGLGNLTGISSNQRRRSSKGSSFSIFGPSKSHRRARPRQNFVSQTLNKLRRLLRDLLYYLKRNPVKVFMLVIMPLITGGALTGLLKQFGVRLPAGVERFIAKMGGNSGRGGGRDGEMQWERRSYEGPVGGAGMDTLMNVAKLFI